MDFKNYDPLNTISLFYSKILFLKEVPFDVFNGSILPFVSLQSCYRLSVVFGRKEFVCSILGKRLDTDFEVFRKKAQKSSKDQEFDVEEEKRKVQVNFEDIKEEIEEYWEIMKLRRKIMVIEMEVPRIKGLKSTLGRDLVKSGAYSCKVQTHSMIDQRRCKIRIKFIIDFFNTLDLTDECLRIHRNLKLPEMWVHKNGREIIENTINKLLKNSNYFEASYESYKVNVHGRDQCAKLGVTMHDQPKEVEDNIFRILDVQEYYDVHSDRHLLRKAISVVMKSPDHVKYEVVVNGNVLNISRNSSDKEIAVNEDYEPKSLETNISAIGLDEIKMSWYTSDSVKKRNELKKKLRRNEEKWKAKMEVKDKELKEKDEIIERLLKKLEMKKNDIKDE